MLHGILHGRAILYADRKTGSIERALAETDTTPNQTSRDIIKYTVLHLAELSKQYTIYLREQGIASPQGGGYGRAQQIAEESAEYLAMSPT